MPRLIHYFIKPTHVNFIGARKPAFFLSLLLCIVSIVSVATKGMNFGIDFKGGVLMEVQAEKPIDMKEMRSKLASLNVDLQPIGDKGTEVLITALGRGDNEQEQMKISNVIRQELGEDYSFRRIEMVGPRVGAELIHNCILALILAGVMITVYVWTRFEWEFALGTMLSLIHDIIIAVGLFSVFQLDFDMTIIAGLMTLAGFSVNDTIVSYDRMRENLHKYRKMPIDEMINKTTNEMLPRTLLTGMSTIIMLTIMLFMGGPVLQGFALMMLWGILVGTYSSIYVAMPVLMYLDIRKTMENRNKDVSPNFN
ncbi:MAG: protein translocase subunit SecF [Alphaproteobacteria bacterium]|nr:protein translocase subunit SecF [Alphaproteobacteria bacterium]